MNILLQDTLISAAVNHLIAISQREIIPQCLPGLLYALASHDTIPDICYVAWQAPPIKIKILEKNGEKTIGNNTNTNNMEEEDKDDDHDDEDEDE